MEYLLLAIILLTLGLYYMLKNRLAIFFPSFPEMIRIIEKFADAGKDDVVYDLGSGDGRVLERFVKKGVKCVGIEQNNLLNRLARRRLKGYKNVKIVIRVNNVVN